MQHVPRLEASSAKYTAWQNRSLQPKPGVVSDFKAPASSAASAAVVVERTKLQVESVEKLRRAMESGTKAYARLHQQDQKKARQGFSLWLLREEHAQPFAIIDNKIKPDSTVKEARPSTVCKLVEAASRKRKFVRLTPRIDIED